jgi:serine/threonine protein kinase
MGVVFKAQDLHLDRFVALKILPPEKVADPERKRRFVQEAKAASALNHPNIVTIHDITQESGTDFIVMEYVEGKTLDQRIGRRGLRLTVCLRPGRDRDSCQSLGRPDRIQSGSQANRCPPRGRDRDFLQIARHNHAAHGPSHQETAPRPRLHHPIWLFGPLRLA